MDSDPPRRRSEYGYLVLGAVALSAAAVVFIVSQLVPAVAVPQGLYSILAGLFATGGCGWVVRSGDALRARALAGAKSELQQRLVAVETLLAALAEQRDVGIRQLRPTATCRPAGHMYVSGQGEAVGIRRGSTVDAPTDPSGATLQRAREDGIEQGFAIGYTAQLAERGVTPLVPRARRSRLMGDS